MPELESPSIVCPQCGKRSYHPKDIEERYCGFCHDWHDHLLAESIPEVRQNMQLADLDTETRGVIVLAHITAARPTEENLVKLRKALARFDKKHEFERHQNLWNALFGPEGIMNQPG